MDRPRILVIGLTDPARDPRVDRQLAVLSSFADVTLASYGRSHHETVEHVLLTRPARKPLDLVAEGSMLIARLFERRSRRVVEQSRIGEALSGRRFSVVLANDVQALPLAFAVHAGAPVIVDLHEYAPRESDESLRWRMLFGRYNEWLCREYLSRVRAATTVCEGIAQEYERNYQVLPDVLTNAPFAHQVSWHPTAPDRIRVLFHGGATRTRRIEAIVDIAPLLDDRFVLDLVLVPGDVRYIDELKARARNMANVRFVDPVPMHRIIDFSSQYDVSLLFMLPTNFNNLHTLPNKFFESLHARLAIAAGPSPEMARIVEAFNCGVVAPAFDGVKLAAMLNALDASQIERMRERAGDAANVHNAEHNGAKLRELVLGTMTRTRTTR